MVSNFSANFALILANESQDRPVHIASIEIARFVNPVKEDFDNRTSANIALEFLNKYHDAEEGS